MNQPIRSEMLFLICPLDCSCFEAVKKKNSLCKGHIHPSIRPPVLLYLLSFSDVVTEIKPLSEFGMEHIYSYKGCRKSF